MSTDDTTRSTPEGGEAAGDGAESARAPEPSAAAPVPASAPLPEGGSAPVAAAPAPADPAADAPRNDESTPSSAENAEPAAASVGSSSEASDSARSETSADDASNASGAPGAEWPAEEPGDDVGNRALRRGVPDDIGNRRGGAPRGPRPPPPAQRTAAPAPAPSQDAAGATEGAPATEGAASETPAGDGDGEVAAVEGAPGATTGKKRRRRRRRKGGAAAGGEGAAVDGADGAEASDAEGATDEAGAEGEEGAPAGAPGEAGPGKKRLRKKGIPPLRERPAFQVGEEVFGKVSKVTDHAIWIDIAGKATGLFDRREILDEEPPAEGDQFIATVASTGVRGGMLVMSRAVPHLEASLDRVEAAAETGEYIDGFVTGNVKGGLEVDIGGLRAFAPASHVDLRHGADLGYLVGQRLEFQVTQYAKKGRDLVVSRRKLLEDKAWAERAELLTKIEPGTVQKGVVRTVMQWGVFVALPEHGGVEGLVHMTEASHDRGAKLTELFRPGDEVEVKILKVDDNGKLWLSRKACVEDPWAAVKEKYAIGTRHKAKIARLQPFGAFVELEAGIDGLIHTADLSLKLISHPSDVVKVGDEIDVVVAACDSGMHRIGLHPAPPPGEEDEPRQKVVMYKPLKVVVHQITEGGLVVRVLGVTGRASRAFIPAGHTGTARGTDLRKTFPIGTRLEGKVIDVDPRRGEAKLSIKALKEDAEKQAFQQYRQGVARDAKFGTFADLMKKT